VLACARRGRAPALSIYTVTGTVPHCHSIPPEMGLPVAAQLLCERLKRADPLIDHVAAESSHTASQTNRIIDRISEGDVNGVVATLIENEGMTLRQIHEPGDNFSGTTFAIVAVRSHGRHDNERVNRGEEPEQAAVRADPGAAQVHGAVAARTKRGLNPGYTRLHLLSDRVPFRIQFVGFGTRLKEHCCFRGGQDVVVSDAFDPWTFQCSGFHPREVSDLRHGVPVRGHRGQLGKTQHPQEAIGDRITPRASLQQGVDALLMPATGSTEKGTPAPGTGCVGISARLQEDADDIVVSRRRGADQWRLSPSTRTGPGIGARALLQQRRNALQVSPRGRGLLRGQIMVDCIDIHPGGDEFGHPVAVAITCRMA